MGLSIHWTLSTQRELSDAVVKELAARTKASARKIGCEKVLAPKRGGPDEIKLHKLSNGDTTGDFIPAESGWSVMVLPGAGSEPAEFGLCRYPGSLHWKLAGASKRSDDGPQGRSPHQTNAAPMELVTLVGWQSTKRSHRRCSNLESFCAFRTNKNAAPITSIGAA